MSNESCRECGAESVPGGAYCVECIREGFDDGVTNSDDYIDDSDCEYSPDDFDIDPAVLAAEEALRFADCDEYEPSDDVADYGWDDDGRYDDDPSPYCGY